MEKLTSLTRLLIQRWTAKSPRAYRIITDISLGIALTASALPLIPITLPAWVIPASAFIIALSAKLTTDNSTQ
jgi:hypothetical protein